jgi:hypothetical protein
MIQAAAKLPATKANQNIGFFMALLCLDWRQRPKLYQENKRHTAYYHLVAHVRWSRSLSVMSVHEPRSDSKAQADSEDDDQETLQPRLTCPPPIQELLTPVVSR